MLLDLKKFDIQISLKECPPNKNGVGVTWLKRIAVKLDTLVVTDDKGNTLQPRQKNLHRKNLIILRKTILMNRQELRIRKRRALRKKRNKVFGQKNILIIRN